MTPVPLDLPLRPDEASQLGNLILEQAERKPLTAEIRNRIAARGAALRLETIVPYFGSLERDPVHPSAYYLAVDGAHGEPMLLHMALATAPTSSIFYRPLLIGRTRRVNGPEMVINAIPFSAADRENLEKFASQINSAFRPKPQGSRTAIAAGPGAFPAFRAILKRTGKNTAAISVPDGSDPAEVYYRSLWAAIRAGWREGYTISLRVEEADIRQVRSALKALPAFDFELPVGADLAARLESLRTAGLSVQFVSPDFSSPEELGELAAICRQYTCTLSIRGREEYGADVLQQISRAAAGRVHYVVPAELAGRPECIDFVAENLIG